MQEICWLGLNRWLAVTTVIFVTTSIAHGQETSIFPDKALEAIVRKSVFEKRNTDQPILAKDVEKISTIKAPKAGIKSIAGLEHCRELRELNLADNQIEDIAPLSGLKYLQSLDVSNNKVASLEALKPLQMLQYLNMAGNQIADLSPLAGHATIWALYLEKNKIADIAVVADLPKLVALYLDDNQVKDISVLAKLTKLERIGLTRNQVTDISPLAASIYWKFLFLEENQIADLAPLVDMCKKDLADRKRFAPFVRVYLEGNPLSDAGKAQLEELKGLGIRLRSTKVKEENQ
jgi:Leucine-rich repeat (LRR) protein